MDHSIARAIRTVGEKICRRLDVLIEAAGQPPVKDIEGTNAPRKPLAPSAAAKNDASLSQPPVTATPAHATPAHATPVPKKRGRPSKVQSAQVSEAATPQNDTPEETCEVSIFFQFVFLFV